MKLFQKRKLRAEPELLQTERTANPLMTLPDNTCPFEKELFDRLRYAVPVIDAAVTKIIRLTGGFRLISNNEKYQESLDRFCETVPTGIGGMSIQTFADNFLDSLITYGSAAGEIVINESEKQIAGLWNGDTSAIKIRAGNSPFDRRYSVKCSNGIFKDIKHPERILYAELTGGKSLLRGLPAVSSILLRIYQCIGQNFDRAGNVRYAVTYKPSGGNGDFAYSRERAVQIAKEWADGMNSAKYGQVKDFIAVGDVDIKVIGAENQLFDTEIPVRQLMEQIIAKLSIPPFLLGLTWNSTERMSSQQVDILTTELEYYRRIMTPVLNTIGTAYLYSTGTDCGCRTEWDNINLQDESVLAETRLNNAKAEEIEIRNRENGGNNNV
ncbi:MAG: serine/threonine protein phosphatase [Ruminococcus sp.]|nr:serine/threonine protein phosphatase [Ruminococcus sp.]